MNLINSKWLRQGAGWFFCLTLILFGFPGKAVAVGPTIEWVKVTPSRVAPDGKSLLVVSAKITHPDGAKAIKDVVVNLTPIGGFGNSKMGDDGWLGDKVAHDNVYTILASVSKDTSFGTKHLMVTVFDRSGWKTFQEGTLNVLDMPSIVGLSLSQGTVVADGKTSVLIAVKIFNPSGSEKVKRVVADLTQLGGQKQTLLRDEGKYWALPVVIPKSLSPGQKTITIIAFNHLERWTARKLTLVVK